MNQPALQSVSPLLPERLEDVRERRQQEALDVESRASSPPRRRSRARRRRPPATSSRTALHRPSSATISSSSTPARLLDVEAAAEPELAPHLADQLRVARLLARRLRARLRQVDRRRSPGSGPGRGDITTTRVERKTASAIECVTKTIVEPGLVPDPQQLAVQALARHLVERAERLVHQQQRRREGERARDRDALLHAARELPRVVVLEAGQLDEVEQLAHALVAAAPVPAEQLERQRDVAARPCASRRARRPGRRSRSRGRAAPGARTCRSRRPRPPSAGSGRRPRAAASTCRSRTGRSARRTRPGATVEVDVLERDDAGLAELLRDALERDDRLRRAHATCSGARRTTSFSTATTTRKNAIPSAAAIRFVAQRLVGELA